MKIGQTKLSILVTFMCICVKHQKTYCWPTRKKIRQLLKQYHQVDVSVSTIDTHLRELRQEGLIKSFKRTGRNPDGTMFNLPSNRQLTKKSVFLLCRNCVRVAKWLIDWVISGVCPGWSKKRSNGPKPQASYVPVRLRDHTVSQI